MKTLMHTGLAATLAVSLIAAPAAAFAKSTDPPVDGVWRSDGYSSVLVVKDGRAALYETTAVSCAPGPVATRAGRPAADGTVRFDGGQFAFTVRPDRRGGGLVQHMDGSVGDRQLLRLPRLPVACTKPGPTGPLATFDVFWQTYADNYPFFAAKGIDWAAVRDRYRPQVRPDMTDAELFGLLVGMIEPLGDAHTGIRTPGNEFIGHRPGTTFPTLELEARIRPYIEEHDLHGPLAVSANGRIGYRDLPGGIGYLRIIAFAGYSEADEPTFAQDSTELDKALDAVLTKQRTSTLRGLVIDLRVNGGGHDALGLRLAARLTDRSYLAYRKQTRNDPDDPARFTRPQAVAVVPAGDRPVYTGPVALLTGGSAMSAGETFTMATFDRIPRPVRIGDNTQGVFSDTLIRTLPNGWQFIVPDERFLTRDGRSFDGAGIAPDRRTPVFTEEELGTGRDSAFDAAIALLSGAGRCAGGCR